MKPMNILYFVFFALFGLFAGFVVGSSGLTGVVQGLIGGAVAGLLLAIPCRSTGNYVAHVVVVATIAGCMAAVLTSDNNVLKQTCSRFGLKISIGGKK
jgi:hypothetical protein